MCAVVDGHVCCCVCDCRHSLHACMCLFFPRLHMWLHVSSAPFFSGRKPHTQDLGLDKIGVEVDQRGRVKVDSKFQTTVPGVFAIGDVIPGPMLAHKVCCLPARCHY